MRATPRTASLAIDWATYDIGSGGPGFGKQTPMGVTATRMLYQDAATMAKITDGQTGRCRDLHRSGFAGGVCVQSTLLDAATGQYDKGSQTANFMALELGLVPEAHRLEVLEHIVADIRAHNDHVTTGEIGYPYVSRSWAGS